MMLWFLFAILAFGLVAVLLAALRTPLANAQTSGNPYDLAVYRDQLAEVERDVQAGTLSPEDAQSARTEISRRILAAHQAPSHKPETAPPSLLWAKAITIIVILLVAIGFYMAEGRPDLPGVIHAERLANAEKTGDFEALIAKVSDHLEKNPSDLRGWQVMATALAAHGRYPQAAEALQGLIRNTTPTADLLADYGEMLVLANEGRMTDKAALSFDEAVKLEPSHPKATFFQGLGLEQQGKTEQAIAIWQALIAQAPADAPWRSAVLGAIEQASAPSPPNAPGMPQLSDEQIAAAKDMSPEDRQAMIRSMVDGLAQKLRLNGKDLEGWLRLANARKMLGDKPAAIKALDDAAEIYKDDQAALAQIAAARQGLTP